MEAEIADARRAGIEVTTSGLLATIRSEDEREENRARLKSITARKAKAVAGLFDVIVIDPPGQQSEPDAAPGAPGSGISQRPIRLCRLMGSKPCVGRMLERHACADCHISWGVRRVPADCLQAAGGVGLELRVRLKNGGPQPPGLPQFDSEFAIYARKGSPGFLDTTDFFTVIKAARGTDSEKPGAFYALLRRVTAGRRLDIFNRRVIRGFQGYGLESPGVRRG